MYLAFFLFFCLIWLIAKQSTNAFSSWIYVFFFSMRLCSSSHQGVEFISLFFNVDLVMWYSVGQWGVRKSDVSRGWKCAWILELLFSSNSEELWLPAQKWASASLLDNEPYMVQLLPCPYSQLSNHKACKWNHQPPTDHKQMDTL